MKIEPLHDNLVVKRLDAEETTSGGIILPDAAKEKPKEGKVVSVGKGRAGKDGKVAALSVKKGDRVLFTSYAGTEVEVNGEELLIMKEDDILAIVE